jgi:hypothetical protein
MGSNLITSEQYIRMVAAAIEGMAQNPAIMQWPDTNAIQNMTYSAMQGVDQAITQAGGQIVVTKL